MQVNRPTRGTKLLEAFEHAKFLLTYKCFEMVECKRSQIIFLTHCQRAGQITLMSTIHEVFFGQEFHYEHRVIVLRLFRLCCYQQNGAH